MIYFYFTMHFHIWILVMLAVINISMMNAYRNFNDNRAVFLRDIFPYFVNDTRINLMQNLYYHRRHKLIQHADGNQLLNTFSEPEDPVYEVHYKEPVYDLSRLYASRLLFQKKRYRSLSVKRFAIHSSFQTLKYIRARLLKYHRRRRFYKPSYY
ncbi:uncharacterized protein LOC126892397 [Diabrotica virgifera virgifera]|uniref:Uncharacterized protein n=1 Tax=Diabrotica virgifera virgifera TaxID=50390 RepID=A0ABM5L619_DIAVI|nr:uncharacterized protein LOC126892397 [Diabrotica virgifera virgifera]